MAAIFTWPTYRITLLDFRVAFFGTVLPFRIDNLHPTHRMQLGWFKKSKPGESPAFLVEDVNGRYYYYHPKASDLIGEVVTGPSRLGLMVLDPFRVPTGSVQINFSGLVVGPARDGATFSFSYQPRQIGKSAVPSASSVASFAAREATALPGIALPRSQFCFIVTPTPSGSRGANTPRRSRAGTRSGGGSDAD